MEEDKKLYPLKFHPVAETFGWGGARLAAKYGKQFVVCDDDGNESRLAGESEVAESHEIADLGYRDSIVREGWLAGNTLSEIMDMYVDRVVGSDVFEFYGRQFPVGIKFIDARERMPLMVHPDNELAEQRYDFLGKTKLWYVVEAQPGATVTLGFSEDVEAAEFYARCIEGKPEPILNEVPVSKGDFFIIEPGTVNSARGVVLLEVSESSPLDFLLCNWGRPVPKDEFDETLNLIDAMDFIDYKAYASAAAPVADDKSFSRTLARRGEFTVTKMKLTDPLRFNSEGFDSFLVYVCLEGEAVVQVKSHAEEESYGVKAGETVLVPADVTEFVISPRKEGTEIIEVMVEKHEELDGYIDPDVEESIDGEAYDDSSDDDMELLRDGMQYRPLI